MLHNLFYAYALDPHSAIIDNQLRGTWKHDEKKQLEGEGIARKKNNNKNQIMLSALMFRFNSFSFIFTSIQRLVFMCECCKASVGTAAFACIALLCRFAHRNFLFKVFCCVFHRFSYFPTACTINSLHDFASFQLIFHFCFRCNFIV